MVFEYQQKCSDFVSSLKGTLEIEALDTMYKVYNQVTAEIGSGKSVFEGYNEFMEEKWEIVYGCLKERYSKQNPEKKAV